MINERARYATAQGGISCVKYLIGTSLSIDRIARSEWLAKLSKHRIKPWAYTSAVRKIRIDGDVDYAGIQFVARASVRFLGSLIE
jgi:hypothetical protein